MILRLTGFELKKLMSATFLKILSALLLILNIALAARAAYKPVRDEDKYYENVYAIYNASPEFFFSEYDRIKREFDSLGPFEFPSAAYGGGVYLDMTLFGDVYDTVTADEAYHQKIEGILTQARDICDNYLANGMEDSYVYGYHLRVIDRYTYLYENVKLDNRPVSGWDKYFGYKAGYFTVFILLAAIGVYAVLADRQCGFYSVAGVCRNGRAKTAAAKLIASALAATAVVCVFTLSSFAAVGIAARGYSSPDNAAQAGLSLRLLPLKLDFKGAFFADLALKIVSAVVFCMLAVLISSAVKQISACISLGIGLAVLNFLISRADEVRFGAWKFLNLYSAYSLAEYAPKYRSVDVLSRPVGLTAVAAAAAVILTAIAVLLSCVLYSKGAPFKFLARGSVLRRSAAGERAGRRAARRGSLSLIFYELYKQRAVYALFAFLFAVKLFASAEYYTPRTSVYDAALKNYINKLGGEFTDEKADLIMREYASCEEIAARFDEVRLDWWNGKITDETYNDMFGEYMSALTDREALRYLAEMSVYLETLRDERGIVGSYVYDTGYYKFASQGVDWALIIFAAVIGCRSYLCENVKNASGTPMLVICGTAARGRGQLFLRKSAVCACSSLCAWFMCRAADAFFFLRSYELPDMSAPLLSMPRYGDTALDLTVAEYTALTAIVSLVGTVTLSLLCLALGIIVKRAIAAYAVAAAVLAVPALAARTGITAAGYFDLTALYDADRLYITSPSFLTPPTYGVCVFAAAVCAAVSLTVYFHRRSERRGL